ncbi:hypothetical protein SLS64_005587 [Diaporthe eres]|uniref:Uncharacterized protein n=1 Tax=Diaporthe eres TaxID=83184 RepID=A0ABR1P9P5_DIAER
MAYVPPALRKRAQGFASDGNFGITAEGAGSLEDLPPDTAPPKSIADLTFSQADIHHHYWSSQNDESGTSATSFGYSQPSTLNSSAQALDKLKYIVLFRDANPRWHSHGIIFVKSKLDILPGGEKFRDVQQPEIGRIDPEQSGDMGYESNTSTNEKETLGGKESHVKLPVHGDQRVGKERQEYCAKGEPSEGIKKNGGGSTESDQHAGTPISDYAHVSRTKAPSPDSDENYEPDPEAPYCPDLSLYEIEPIAVFEQASRHQGGPFRFAGYYKIASLGYLAPRSRELFQLLEQKFTQVDRFGRAKQKQRSAASWKASMKHRWAVIRMEKDQDANDSLPPPKIEVGNDLEEKGDASSPKKSVNELLKELRMKD